MDRKICKTRSVYGISRELPLNYVERKEVDQKLVDNLTKDKHIVIYGSSKQGKTSLRKHCLSQDDYILIQCSNRWGLIDIHSAILKGVGYQITQSVKKPLLVQISLRHLWKQALLFLMWLKGKFLVN
jgi:AAA+ ATPase superfamily predicted ATPase